MQNFSSIGFKAEGGVVMGPGKIFLPELGQVNFLWLRSGWVSHICFGFEFGKFPLKMSNF